MKASTRNRIKGTAQATKGRAKQALGYVTRSKRLAAEGKADAVKSRARQRMGEIEEDLEDAD